MRGFRLNGWQRIGIILSVLWIPVAGRAYAADKLAFTCSGSVVFDRWPDKVIPLTDQSLTIDLDAKLAVGFLGLLVIDPVTEPKMKLKSRQNPPRIAATLDRYSGALSVERNSPLTGHSIYDLTCKAR
jgi:hypothetical protein